MPKPILYTSRNGIGRLKLNRPRVRNALNMDAWEAFGLQVDRIQKSGSIRCLIVSGNGRGFCAGTDIRDLDGATEDVARSLARMENDVLCRLEDLPMPTIAAIHGFALGGGCELAMSCDMRIAAEGSVFGQPEIDLGWMPAAGGTFRLPRLVGETKAKEMIFTGKPFDTAEALRIGLINRVVSGEELESTALELAAEIASKDPAAIQAAKHALADSADREQAIGREAEALARLATSKTAQDRIRGFLHK